MWAYLEFAGARERGEPRAKKFYLLTLLFFVLGLMSKTMLVTLPCVFFLLDHWPLKRWNARDRWRLIREKIPFFLLVGAVSVAAWAAQRSSGATSEMVGLSFADRLGNALVSYVRYPLKFFWPHPLCIYYPHPGHWPAMIVAAAGLFLALVTWFAWTQRERRPYWFVGWSWYLGTLVPVIGLVQLYSQSMADRYTYVPLIGIYWILVWGLADLPFPARFKMPAFPAVTGVAVVACCALTRHEIGFWKDSATVWGRAAAVTKDNYVAHNSLGVFCQQNQPDAALREFAEAVRIKPDFAEAQRNLGDALYNHERWDDAIVHYQKSLDVNPHSSWDEAGLGYSFYKKGRYDDAIVHLQKAVAYAPAAPNYRNDLGALLAAKGRTGEAIAQFRKAVELAPNDAHFQDDLGSSLLVAGQVDEAIERFDLALKLNPDFNDARAHRNVALKTKAQAATPAPAK